MMMESFTSVLFVFVTISSSTQCLVQSFTSPTTTVRSSISSATIIQQTKRNNAFTRYRKSQNLAFIHQMNLSSDGSNENESAPASSTPKRRRKRKDGKNVQLIDTDSNSDIVGEVVKDEPTIMEEISTESEVSEYTSPSTSSPPPARTSKPVQLQVFDVRDVVSGGTTATSTSSNTQIQDNKEKDDDDEYEYYDDDEEDDEYEYYYEDENDNEVIVATGSKDSSLEALLADAKRMRQEEKSKDEEEGGLGVSIPGTIRSVISNIVTIDFFVVCALLAWFLAGIFCSYIIKDDTVQIAFNGMLSYMY